MQRGRKRNYYFKENKVKIYLLKQSEQFLKNNNEKQKKYINHIEPDISSLFKRVINTKIKKYLDYYHLYLSDTQFYDLKLRIFNKTWISLMKKIKMNNYFNFDEHKQFSLLTQMTENTLKYEIWGLKEEINTNIVSPLGNSNYKEGFGEFELENVLQEFKEINDLNNSLDKFLEDNELQVRNTFNYTILDQLQYLQKRLKESKVITEEIYKEKYLLDYLIFQNLSNIILLKNRINISNLLKKTENQDIESKLHIVIEIIIDNYLQLLKKTLEQNLLYLKLNDLKEKIVDEITEFILDNKYLNERFENNEDEETD